MLCIRLLCPALLSLALLLPGVAAGAVPEKPADHILDQAGALGNTEKQNLAAELQKTAENMDLNVFLLFLKEPPGDPADYAEDIAEAWGAGSSAAAIVRSPGAEPAIAFAGPAFEKFSAEQKNGVSITAIQEGRSKGRTSSGTMIETARSIIAQMQDIRNGAAPASIAQSAEARTAQMKRLALWLLLPAALAAGLSLWWLRRRKAGALLFPVAEYRRRFSAPHSGGNNAMISFPNTRGGKDRA